MTTLLFIITGIATLAFLWGVIYGKYGHKDPIPPIEEFEMFWTKNSAGE